MTDIAPPRFELYEITTEEEFAEAFPVLKQLAVIEMPETVDSLTPKKAWGQYQASIEQSYHLYIAKNTNEVLGVVGLRVCNDPLSNGKPYAIINNLVVEEDYRGLGIGTDMLERVELIAAKYKCDMCLINFLKNNKKAKEIYEAVGYNYIANMMVKEI